MEKPKKNVASFLDMLSWDSGEDCENCDEDFEQQETALGTKEVVKFRTNKWLKKSKKSIIRMLAVYMMWNSNEQPSKKKKFIERSIVRKIASKLPLQPSKRAYFEMFCESNKAMMSKAKTFVEDNISNVKSHMPEMGLADIGLFSWDDFEEGIATSSSSSSSLSRKDIITRSTLDASGLSVSHNSEVSHDDIAIQPRCLKRGKKLREKGTSEKKIIALEDELANLRAQIAMIVTAQDKPKAAEAPMIPVAPPAPPLPLPSIKIKAATTTTTAAIAKEKSQKESTKEVPTMKDVLVGLSSIKLKSSNIKRSPGGTPLRVKSSNIPNSSSNDPADIIANALRKKFAKARRSIGSPIKGKENQFSPSSGFSPSPQSSPDVLLSPITSSPQKPSSPNRAHRRKSNKLNGKQIILSPVNEN
eukprot:gene4587-5190_t